MKPPTKEEIELRLMEIFNRVEVKQDIKKATAYILKIIKNYEARNKRRKT